MSIRNLEYLFHPKSVAVVGASMRPGKIGRVVMNNLLNGEFDGPVMPVNPKYESVCGVLSYPSILSLPVVPDLAVICTPPHVVPAMIEELGKKGARAAIVLTAGVSQQKGRSGKTLAEEMTETARPYMLRIIGPNSLGFLATDAHLNASFSHMAARPGSIAFVSQSGALCTAVLDWAHSRGIGFSYFISLGDIADVDFADVLDYISGDAKTRAILLYIESIKNARKFMSAARSAARNKMVLSIKAGRVPEGAKAAATHTGVLAGSDDIYEAAICRSGMLRVFSIEELFNAVETLAKSKPYDTEDLTILTNGGGPGVLATDALITAGGRLTELSGETIEKLDAFLPLMWSRSNPVDIIGDADGSRYEKALEILLQDKNTGTVLVMHVPTAISSSTEAAKAVIRVISGSKRNVLTSWLGHGTVDEARKLFAEEGIPTYDTPEGAVRAFMHMVNYNKNQQMLMEVPPSVPEDFNPDHQTARLMIEKVLASGRSLCNEPESKLILSAYGIPVVKTKTASSPEEAREIAEGLKRPFALKILSPDISHKSRVGGVALDLDSPMSVFETAKAMQIRISRLEPDVRLEGFSVQEMVHFPKAHELIIGVTTDPIFGPVILFGQGGTEVESVSDLALALPPLNMNLARELISRTRIYRLFRGYRESLPNMVHTVCLILIKVSQLVIDMGEIAELDINPLLADEQHVIGLDARIGLIPSDKTGAERLAIRPYPRELEESTTLPSGRRVFLRPIRPEDEPAHYDLFSRLDPEDIRFRFFGLVRDFPHSEMARFTQIDYEREMAFIATVNGKDKKPETLGVVRAIMQPRNNSAEFAIILRSDLKGQGLGRKLLEKMIRYCKMRGIRTLVGQVLEQNYAMLGLAEKIGFTRGRIQDGAVEVILRL